MAKSANAKKISNGVSGEPLLGGRNTGNVNPRRMCEIVSVIFQAFAEVLLKLLFCLCPDHVCISFAFTTRIRKFSTVFERQLSKSKRYHCFGVKLVTCGDRTYTYLISIHL